jgi:hypothetical protein
MDDEELYMEEGNGGMLTNF